MNDSSATIVPTPGFDHYNAMLQPITPVRLCSIVEAVSIGIPCDPGIQPELFVFPNGMPKICHDQGKNKSKRKQSRHTENGMSGPCLCVSVSFRSCKFMLVEWLVFMVLKTVG